MAGTLALPRLIEHAGAVMTERDGGPVPAHYGSAPGELAVCVRAVGLCLRSDLALLTVTAGPRSLDRLLERVLGRAVVPGGAALEAGAWWCRHAERDELLVLARRATGGRLVRALGLEVRRLTNGALFDSLGDRAIIGVVGRRTPRVLADLGVAADDPRAAPAFVRADDADWLLQADTAALAVVDQDGAAALWQAIDDAGRPYGISCVGIEAVDRYLMTQRAARTGISLL